MKKLNSKGFILAETLIVSVFLMVLFTMIYTNFYPIIGMYEIRENYDDVDGKYNAYWIKKMIESEAYNLNSLPASRRDILVENMNMRGYMRFECQDMSEADNQRELCVSLVKSLGVENCDRDGNNCDIFITRFQIGNNSGVGGTVSFKEQVQSNQLFRYNETCRSTSDICKKEMFQNCCTLKGLGSCTTPKNTSVPLKEIYNGPYNSENDKIATYCQKLTLGKAFSSAERDYILSLPNYSKSNHSSTGARFRVIVVTRNTRDQNNYLDFSTMEVIK